MLGWRAGGKAALHLAVLGHVDAGKSTLMGRLLYELGHVSQKASGNSLINSCLCSS